MPDQNYPMIESEVGAAARRKSQVILDEMFWTSTKSALDDLSGQRAMEIIDISCASGGITLPILELLKPEGKVIAFDCDNANIELVAGKVEQQYAHQVTFINSCFESWSGTANANLILGRCILNDLEKNRAIVRKATTLLSKDGILILEFVDFSKSQCFPRSYALDRYCEYMRTYQQALQQPAHTPELMALCTGTDLQPPMISTLVPRFLEDKHKQLPSLMLEYLTPFIIENDPGSQMELQAIIIELRQLANQPSVMITAPTGVRLKASRS